MKHPFMLTVLALLSVVRPTAAADPATALVGSWRLVEYVIIDANGASRPGNYDAGQITYDADGNMSAQLMRARGRATAAPTNDAERAAAYNSYLAYYGPFTLDAAKGTVVHHVRGSSYPHWVGTDQVRHFTLSQDGSRLLLSLKDGERVTQTLTWARIK